MNSSCITKSVWKQSNYIVFAKNKVYFVYYNRKRQYFNLLYIPDVDTPRYFSNKCKGCTKTCETPILLFGSLILFWYCWRFYGFKTYIPNKTTWNIQVCVIYEHVSLWSWLKKLSLYELFKEKERNRYCYPYM